MYQREQAAGAPGLQAEKAPALLRSFNHRAFPPLESTICSLPPQLSTHHFSLPPAASLLSAPLTTSASVLSPPLTPSVHRLLHPISAHRFSQSTVCSLPSAASLLSPPLRSSFRTSSRLLPPCNQVLISAGAECPRSPLAPLKPLRKSETGAEACLGSAYSSPLWPWALSSWPHLAHAPSAPQLPAPSAVASTSDRFPRGSASSSFCRNSAPASTPAGATRAGTSTPSNQVLRPVLALRP